MVTKASAEGNGKALLVKAVSVRAERDDTYNFEVAESQNYFVGKLQAWVHNTCSATDLIANGGKHLDQNTIVGAYGNKFVKQADGSYANVGAASPSEIAQSGVTVRPNPNTITATNTGRPIEFDGQFYSADGFKCSKSYYEYLYNNGRPAPFLQAR